MKKIELTFNTIRRRYPRWLHLILAAMLVLGLGIGQGLAAKNNNNGKKPIPSKSANKAALKAAAAAVLLAPAGPTDATKVPHYYGPFPNWANSPFTLPDATVVIDPSPLETPTDPTPTATATATVNALGEVTGVTITNTGFGYDPASPPLVTITDTAGTNTSATATADITTTGAVTAISVDAGGAGYTAPVVAISGGGGTGATATAYGGVLPDGVTIINGGSGYTFPTVDFDMPDGPDGVKATAYALTKDDGTGNGTLTITEIVVDQPGSGYTFPPKVVIRNGTIFDPIPGANAATATATLYIQTVVVNDSGAGYTSPPDVAITEPDLTNTTASATATVNTGAVTAINLTPDLDTGLVGGSGYLTAGGIKKFQDELPMLCNPSVADSCLPNSLGQYLPLAVPDTTTFSAANPDFPADTPDADYYVIGLVQTREQMNSSLPPTLLREYVQIETPDNTSWSKGVQLANENLDPSLLPSPILVNNQPVFAVDDPHFLGPVIAATKDKPVRILFYNLLPTGNGGDLFLPTDSTIMGSGPHPQSPPELFDPIDSGTVMDAVRNQVCTEYPKSADCFKDNRATLHLHGGITPWISDGTPHQWNTPAGEVTPYPEGASQRNVPDMWFDAGGALIAACAGQTTCAVDGATNDPGPGAMTFYYTNQQSARLMFYHDHAWGITRLGVYAGGAAGYLIADETEDRLINGWTDSNGGIHPPVIPAAQIPLVIQDRTFVPLGDPDTRTGQLYEQDPTWDETRWGGYGNFWYHHVYMPAQNPGDPTGMSAFGRWMYGPWFWPPATPPFGPIANPYYTGNCNPADPLTWDWDTDPFCEPELIPGTPNISVGMEQFNDTPIVNGTAYPTLTVEPKAYRLRILNAANDRFWNLQWYVADPASETDPLIGPTEVALKQAELDAAQIDPNIFPTPDTTVSLPGPDWVVIGNEGGFLPAPVIVDGQQPTTWIIDPTVFNVGNVDKHSLLVASAERFDVIVDFSQHANETLILYNDAPAAFPARVASYDYYTGAPDLSPVGAPAILPGYGPNTRTIMQVKVAAANTDPVPFNFDLAALQTAFSHKADGSGVFESGQHPIIVGQAEYNSAYGTSFVSVGNCNGGSTSTVCDGHLRIADQGGTLFGFNTLLQDPSITSDPTDTTFTAKLEIPIEPKAIHDEMNATAFDEFGRMQANIGLEVVPATPATQNAVLYPYVNPPTELIDLTNLPENNIDTLDFRITPIASADGTQIWKITHNGVDTHPLHWHLYDVQVLNRVTWDNIISPPHPTELGWKDTLRVSPLEDTIVALRPIVPQLPFELPNSIRPMHPMMPIGATMGFNNVDANGNPTVPIVNDYINFGWEYVWHCHILSHEEMDMMRPVAAALPPNAVTDLTATLSASGKAVVTLDWTDQSLNETQFLVQRMNGTGPWVTLTTFVRSLNPTAPIDQQPDTTGSMSYVDDTYKKNTTYSYRIVADNTVGYGGQFMELTAQSFSNVVGPPTGETILVSALPASKEVMLKWSYVPAVDPPDQTGFTIQQATDANFTNSVKTIQVVGGNETTYLVDKLKNGTLYYFRVSANNFLGNGPWSNPESATPQ